MNPYLSDFFEFLKIPTVSTDSSYSNDVIKGANFLNSKFKKIGLSSDIHQTGGHPLVLAKSSHKPDKPNVLIYGHYDVQPADPLDEWNSDPFDPIIKDGRVYCRGSSDNKGQHFSHIVGVEQELKEYGELPINVIFLIEGEEEIGSPNLVPFLEKNKELLKSDICVVSDTGMIGEKSPALTYGLRGISCMEITVHGPSIDLHSGIYGGAVPNPAIVLSKLISSIHSDDGKINIDGFYNKVKPLKEWERDMWKLLPSKDSDVLKETGTLGLWGEEGYTSIEQRWGRPSAEINGITSGYQGEGSKTIIPKKASSKISFRLVPDQNPDEILDLAKVHFEKHCPPYCRIEVKLGHSGPPYIMDTESEYFKSAKKALKNTFSTDPYLIREGGSIPIIQSFKDILNIDTLLLGLALPDSQIHAPNENFSLENFEFGIKLNRSLLREIA